MRDASCTPFVYVRFFFFFFNDTATTEIYTLSLHDALPICQSIFTCGTQTNYFQRMELLGTTGRLAVEIPFNAPNDRPTQVTVADGMAIYGGIVTIEEIPACDQYTIQGDAFSRAIRENSEVPVPLEDALGNMKVIDAIFRAAKSGKW